MRVITTLFLALFSIVGCAGISIDKLDKSERQLYFNISEKIVAGKFMKHELLPGKYNSVGSDNDGTFFMGHSLSVFEIGETTQNGPYTKICKGGIFIPHDLNKNKAYTFVINNSCEDTDKSTFDSFILRQTTEINTTATGVAAPVASIGAGLGVGIASAMINAEQGRIFKGAEIDDLKEIESILKQLPARVLSTNMQ